MTKSLRNPDRRVLALAIVLLTTLAQSATTWAGTDQPDGTEIRVRQGHLNFRVIPARITPIPARDPAFRWENRIGQLELVSGSTIVSRDSALFEIERYSPVMSSGRTRSGESVVFARMISGDPRLLEIRVAATPEENGTEANLFERISRPTTGPWIQGYEFQTADLMGSRYLGLWRRTGAQGPQTILAHFPPTPGLGATVIATSDRRYSLISIASTLHGASWGFTLFTEAAPGEPMHMLNYVWWTGTLTRPGIGDR